MAIEPTAYAARPAGLSGADLGAARSGLVLYSSDLHEAVASLERHGVALHREAEPGECYIFADPGATSFNRSIPPPIEPSLMAGVNPLP